MTAEPAANHAIPLGPIPFIDLAAQQERLRPGIEAGIARVLAHGGYIMGPEVRALEAALAAFCGANRAIACANGTDALMLALMALGAGPGDAVFCPSFTFAATAEAPAFLGASPVFVDIDPQTFNLCVASLRRAIEAAREAGLRPVGVIPVDLFGLPADYDAIEEAATAAGLWVLADTAQGFGAGYRGRRAGAIGHAATTSFFPAKPLGCYGDGGAVLTNDETLAELVDSYRIHGKGRDKYDNTRIGMNSRLDTIQAAILIEKLAIFDEEIAARGAAAARYGALLERVVETPREPEGCRSTWAQYTVTLPRGCDREAVQASMKAEGVPTAVYYPAPLHTQSAYAAFPRDASGLPVSEDLAGRVLSLPMHPYLTEAAQARVAAALGRALAAALRPAGATPTPAASLA